MLIHVKDAVTLQGARTLRTPFIIPYGIHQEYELSIVTGHDNRPVDIESRGCVKWTLTVTPSPENPTKVLAYAVFPENIATGNSVRFDLAATSVEMYKQVAGNPATPAVLQLQGFTEEDAPATLVITLPVALTTTSQQRLPVDLSTALMQELQLAVSTAGAAQRVISQYATQSDAAAERAEQAAMNAHASEVNAQGSATAAGVSAGNARESELAAEGSAIAAAGSASDALVSAEAAHESEIAAKASEDAAALSESNAHDSEVAAKASEDAALASQNAAHGSEVAAKASEDAALASQNAAHASEQAAAQSASAAATYEGNAAASATAAAASAQAAATSETNADASDTSAQLAAQAAEYARNGAVDAKVLAETAQSAAESAATDAADETADAIEGQFRDDLSALSTAVNSAQSAATVATTSQQSASASAVSAQQSAAEAYEYAQQAGLNTVLILDAPPTVNTAAAVGKLAIWHDTENDKNHIYHLGFISIADSSTFYHWEECVLVSQGNVAGGYPVLDENGKIASAQLSIAAANKLGAVMPSTQGINVTVGGFLSIDRASNAAIDVKASPFYPIVPSNLDYAVRSVLPSVTEIPAATSDYSLVDSSATTNNHSHVYSHAPTTAPTYRLPQVTNTTIAHYIELTVDFTNVQTYSFLDHAGEPIVPLFTPSIAAGDVYTFKMEYSAIKAAWLVYPQKQGAVADDFVMRGEVGAANGVPSLDANAQIPSNQIPKAVFKIGGVAVGNTNGLTIDSSNGYILLLDVSSSAIDSRRSIGGGYGAITTKNLNYAVTAALTDANHITLTDAQKATAQSVFGVPAPLLGTTAPTTSTVGVIGQLYVDTVTSKTYHCTAVTNTGTESDPVMEYTWTDDINANGGQFNQNIDITNNLAKLRHGVSLGNIGAYSALIATNSCATAGQYSLVCGFRNKVWGSYTFACGNGSHIINGVRITGGGAVNLEEVDWSGNLLINGGFQQNTHVIPADTTEYTLPEGVSLHLPSLPSVYILPKIYARYIMANNQVCIHTGTGDGDGFFKWTFMNFAGQLSYYYTSSLYPAAGDYAYENTALTLRPHPISLPDDITHECILTIKFSSTVLTYEFQDSAGITLVPLPLNGDIEAGSVVTFLCRYNPLLSQWVIYPVMDGQEAQA